MQILCRRLLHYECTIKHPESSAAAAATIWWTFFYISTTAPSSLSLFMGPSRTAQLSNSLNWKNAGHTPWLSVQTLAKNCYIRQEFYTVPRWIETIDGLEYIKKNLFFDSSDCDDTCFDDHYFCDWMAFWFSVLSRFCGRSKKLLIRLPLTVNQLYWMQTIFFSVFFFTRFTQALNIDYKGFVEQSLCISSWD